MKREPSGGRWSFFIDRGGTFTDCIGREPGTGRLFAIKVLSGELSPVLGIRTLLGLAAHEPVAPCDVRLGTTLATNALLERRGEPCALVITRGFADLLEIGTQARPHLFDLEIKKPRPLPTIVIETDARCDAAGAVLEEVDVEAVRAALAQAHARGVDSVAVVVHNDYRTGSLEKRVAEIARSLGFYHVIASHEAAPEIGLLARADTTVLDAYVTPVLARSVRALAEALPGASLRLLTSSGALVDGARFRGPEAVLSGPAGGVVAVAALANAYRLASVIGFDMGGTSTDVCRFAGRFERVYEGEVAGVRVRAPRMDVHTVAAGGGSYCVFDGVRARVGPESAGANPGPLCYGRAEATTLTLTDVDLALGRLVGDRFPIPLEDARVSAALRAVEARMAQATGVRRSLDEVAWGFAEIADTAMAEAIRRVTVARGHDPRDHALVVYGGAGGQHACAIARRLGMTRIVSHPLAGAFSALGIGLTRVGWARARGVDPLDLGDAAATMTVVDEVAARLSEEARGALAEAGPAERVSYEVQLDLRYEGTHEGLTLPLEPRETLRARFDAEHAERFGHARASHAVEVTVVRMEAHGPTPAVHAFGEDAAHPAHHGSTKTASAPLRYQRMVVQGAAVVEAPVYAREALCGCGELAGPALILDSLATLVLEPGFVARVDDHGAVWIEADAVASRVRAPASAGELAPDPLRIEVFHHQFMAIAEQMGDVLRRTALSTNIRERLDFSCAVFDGDGDLVANAPHIPVHLGAMGETVRAVRAMFPRATAGDVFVTNDPDAGGSHLPDVTVVTPVFDEAGVVRFFSASRGHHADIGGPTPGSMPPFSRTLADEGIVIPPMHLVREGTLQEASLRACLSAGRHPARRVDDNLADLVAQAAANQAGARLLRGLCAEHGALVVSAFMKHVQDASARAVAAAIASLPEGERTFEDALDDGTVIRVRARIAGGELDLDFAGTGAEHAGNLNAPRAVVMACVLYVVRSLVSTSLPLNAGCLRPVRVAIPAGSILSPSRGRAVVAGNVETSQRVVDVLLGALGLAAASQGTMNNFSFGDGRLAYYETVCGGAGAGPGFIGASAVHTHMTNTRITDPEILEARFPVRLLRFSVRRGSGGAGRWRGGDGVVRELKLLAPLSISVLSQRRTRAPFGLAGGAAGEVGRNFIDGREVGACVSSELAAGARVRIETPGGGGYGRPDEEPRATERTTEGSWKPHP